MGISTKSTNLFFGLSVALSLFLSHCQEDKPETPGSSSSDQGKKDYYGWGAKVGSDATLRALATCNEAGFFYDRSAQDGLGECDKKTRVADFKCTSYEETLKGMELKGLQVEKLQELVAGDFKDYLFDQCIDNAKEAQYVVSLVKVVGKHEIEVRSIQIMKQ